MRTWYSIWEYTSCNLKWCIRWNRLLFCGSQEEERGSCDLWLHWRRAFGWLYQWPQCWTANTYSPRRMKNEDTSGFPWGLCLPYHHLQNIIITWQTWVVLKHRPRMMMMMMVMTVLVQCSVSNVLVKVELSWVSVTSSSTVFSSVKRHHTETGTRR